MSKRTKNLRDYLTHEELEDMLQLLYMASKASFMEEDWFEKGNLTEEEAELLKKVNEDAMKFYALFAKRLTLKEKIKIKNGFSEFEFYKIIDKTHHDIVFRELDEKMRTAVIPRDDFDVICEEIMDVSCAGCTKHHDSCELCTAFENNLAPAPTGYNKPNCRYAYDKNVKFIRE